MYQRVLFWFSWTTIVCGMGLVMHLSYVLFFPFTIFDIKHSPLPILNENKIVKEGENLIYSLDYCKYKDLPATISYQLVDGIVISLPQKTSLLPEGCRKVVLSSVQIPYGVHSTKDKYKLIVNAEYRIHPLRTISYKYETEEFTIKKR